MPEKNTKKNKALVMNQNNKDSFCALPWVHMFISPDGEAWPCCLRDMEAQSFGNIVQSSAEKIWNSDSMKQFRTDLNSGKQRPDVCKRCYFREQSGVQSHRQYYNQEYADILKKVVPKMKQDGHLEDFKLYYWDFRFSNTCNFRCRTCGPIYSSSWRSDAENLGWLDENTKNILKATESIDYSFLENHLNDVRKIYFAGGEPLLMDIHYWILDSLIKRGRQDVQLTYNSNMSHLKFKNKNVLELWKHFSNVHVSSSIDDIGERAEYSRKGTKWSQVLQNILQIKKELPHVTRSVTLTVSVFNVMNLPEIHKEMIQQKIINPYDPASVFINMVDSPSYYHVAVLPQEMRQKAKDQLSFYQDSFHRKYQQNTNIFNPVLQALDLDKSGEWNEFRKTTQNIDSLRGESFQKTYPELSHLF